MDLGVVTVKGPELSYLIRTLKKSMNNRRSAKRGEIMRRKINERKDKYSSSLEDAPVGRRSTRSQTDYEGFRFQQGFPSECELTVSPQG